MKAEETSPFLRVWIGRAAARSQMRRRCDALGAAHSVLCVGRSIAQHQVKRFGDQILSEIISLEGGGDLKANLKYKRRFPLYSKLYFMKLKIT